MMMTPAADQMQNATQTMMQAYEDMGTMAREHMDATMKSASAMSKGLNEIVSNTQTMLQDSFTRSVNASKNMMTARTLPEITDMHQELMKDMFETWVAVTGKISQISARLTQDVMGPITEQANESIGKITKKLRVPA